MPIGELDCIFKAWMTYIPSLSLRHLFVWGRAPATKNLSMGSVHTVVKWATRWVQMNVRWQCPSCNLLHKGLKDFEQERHCLGESGRIGSARNPFEAQSRKAFKICKRRDNLE